MAHIIFDFDSTLADTHDQVIDSVQAIISKETGVERTRDEIVQRFIANSEDLYPQFGIDMKAPGVRKRLDDHWRDIARLSWEKIGFFKEVPGLLKQLMDNNHRLHILTLRDRESTEKVLKRFDLMEYFDGIACGDDDVQKPNPTALWNLFPENRPEPHEIFMVGDSPIDIALAKNAGVQSIHALWCDFAKGVQLGDHLKPTYIAEHPLDCLSLIEQHPQK